tara:strand:+ start:656 stop:1183 length:528 start_codon:yes stop_codon:yes gene_type:complete
LQRRNTAVFIDPDITIIDKLITEEWLCQITDAALNCLGVTDNKSIEIAITDDQKMTDLNLRHLGIDSTTDVLSFSNTHSPNKKNAASEEEEEGMLMSVFIGEVVISNEQAERQADEKGISCMQEIAFLLAHGILHLLGWDHETEDERIEMENLHRKTLCAMLGESSIQIDVNYLA